MVVRMSSLQLFNTILVEKTETDVEEGGGVWIIEEKEGVDEGWEEERLYGSLNEN